QPAKTLSARAQSWRHEFRTGDGSDRNIGRPLRRRTLERAALFEQALALADRPSYSGVARLASPVSRRIVRAVHESAWRDCRSDLRSQCGLGTDAGRVPPICKRPRDLFRVSQLLSRAGLDPAAARP